MIVRHTDVISENRRLKFPFMIPLKTIFAWKPRQRDATVFKLCNFYCLSICLIITVFSFVCAKLHFRFSSLSAFWHASLLNKLCQIFERYLSNVSFPWHIPSLWFSINTNRLPSDNSQELKIRFKINPITKCQTHTVKKHTPFQYIPALRLVT